jgi:aspartyl-tRNA(Asn)/glutamyl-tRNA(Gln) amidotransferase subunit C
MSLERSDIEKLALLARINISDSESQQVTERIGAVLNLVDQLQAQDTEGVEPMAHPMYATQILRADEVTESNDRENLMSNAPAAEEGLFLVPKVIE